MARESIWSRSICPGAVGAGAAGCWRAWERLARSDCAAVGEGRSVGRFGTEPGIDGMPGIAPPPVPLGGDPEYLVRRGAGDVDVAGRRGRLPCAFPRDGHCGVPGGPGRPFCQRT